MRDVLVRAQELGGKWVALGADSARGIVVEDLICSADEFGPSTASWTMRRRTNVPWPDLGADAPVEIESQCLPVWSGRINGTPTTDGDDRRISVNAEGWQNHLDDDDYQRTYVHSDLTDWVDVRSLLTAQLGQGAGFHPASCEVSTGASGITLMTPKDINIGQFEGCSVQIDLGPNSANYPDVRVVADITTSNNDGNFSLFCFAGNDPRPQQGVFSTLFSQTINVASATLAGGTTPGQRYISFRLQRQGAAITPGVDIWASISRILVFASGSFESGNQSILLASTIIKDARSRATLLLSPDTSKIVTTSFAIPSFEMTGPATPREVMTAANAYHGYQLRVGFDKLLEYRPQPATPVIQLDARATFDEASAGDASAVYSSCIVDYTDAGGQQQTTQRSQPAAAYLRSSIQPTNPGANVDTSNWAALYGTLSRTTTAGEFTEGAGGFKMQSIAGGGGLASTSSWTGGTFIAGSAYRLTFDIRGNSGVTLGGEIRVDGIQAGGVSVTGTGAFSTTVALDWIQPSASAPVLNITAGGGLSAGTFYFDNFTLYEAQPTVVNRRGFRRTYVLNSNMTLSPAGAQQIADTFLLSHRTTPLKGQCVVVGYGSARKNPSGAGMPACELLLNTGELVRMAHLIDPDTGNVGREGRIAQVTWEQKTDTATIDIDSTMTNFEAMLARLSLVTGQVPG